MVVVTGAAGFIGSNLIKKVKKNSVCCDPAKEDMLCPKECIRFLKETKENVECVFHLGAISSTTECDIASLTRNNILLSCELLEVCVQKGIPFVYASSASVYGMGNSGFLENATTEPLNYYAVSKASFDMYALQKIKDNPSAKIVGLRYFNVYGDGEEHKGDMASPIHKFVKQARDAGEIRVFEGSENFSRDFIHVDDVVSLTIAAKGFRDSGIYNVGTGVARSFLDVANIVSEKMHAKIIKIPFPSRLKGKYQEFTRSNNKKLHHAISHDFLSLEDGISKYLEAK